MPLSVHDQTVIRSLAHRVAEIAHDPSQERNRAMWLRLNRRERVRPLIHVQALAANIWEELVPASTLRCTEPWCRSQELELRKRIYVWENFRDDRVIDDRVVAPLVLTGGSLGGWDWGLPASLERSPAESGAYAFRPVIVEERDIEKIQTMPTLAVEREATERQYQRLCALYAGILTVEKRGADFFWFAPMDNFIRWRGIEQMFVDLIERPQWVHQALERVTVGYENFLDQMERLNALSLGNGNTRLGSGGYAWTDELPQPGFDGEKVRLRDLWARAATQIFTDGISAEMHAEFAIRYEKRLLERFGLACYGCCEPLHRKMHVVRQIRNLRRVSMSPWVDLDEAAAAVGRDYILTHKPNPTIVSMESWHPDLARRELRAAFTKTRNNLVEVNLQDLHTVRNEPHRLSEWTRLALELAEEFA